MNYFFRIKPAVLKLNNIRTSTAIFHLSMNSLLSLSLSYICIFKMHLRLFFQCNWRMILKQIAWCYENVFSTRMMDNERRTMNKITYNKTIIFKNIYLFISIFYYLFIYFLQYMYICIVCMCRMQFCNILLIIWHWRSGRQTICLRNFCLAYNKYLLLCPIVHNSFIF